MPNKKQAVIALASEEIRSTMSSPNRYIDFLDTAAQNYKYNYREQVLIHAQKPDATACADIETWNKLGRWVNKGTKGIALLVDHGTLPAFHRGSCQRQGNRSPGKAW